MIFEIPHDVHYFNFAGMSPLPTRTRIAGEKAVSIKSTPWAVDTNFHFFQETDLARGLFAQLIGAQKQDIALIPSATYGITTAVQNLNLTESDEIVLMADEFPALYYPIQRATAERGAKLILARPESPNSPQWTQAILNALSARTRAVALSPCHWTDGSVVDLHEIRETTRRRGIQLIVDGCQYIGANPFSIADCPVDHLIVPTYKWLLGPYSFGFHYIAPQHQNGKPLEEYWASREGAEDFSQLVKYTDQYQKGARRFDMGERSNLILLPMAIESLRIILENGPLEFQKVTSEVVDEIAEAARKMDLVVPDRSTRSRHMIGIRKPGGWRSDFLQSMTEAGIHLSLRGDCARISPHVSTRPHDVDALLVHLLKEARAV